MVVAEEEDDTEEVEIEDFLEDEVVATKVEGDQDEVLVTEEDEQDDLSQTRAHDEEENQEEETHMVGKSK